jgi:DNA-binding IscR family transcriptional regulator
MNNRTLIQYAVMCLQELDQHTHQFLSSRDISKNQGIPRTDCDAVLQRLALAGLIESAEAGQFSLRTPIEDLKALDIIQAVSTPVTVQPAFKLLFSAQKTALRKTLETTRWAQTLSVFPSDGGAARA